MERVIRCVDMKARMLVGARSVREKVRHLRQEAEADGARRVARRLHAIQLNLDGHSGPEIARILSVHRANVSLWLRHWEAEGLDGLLEGHRSGRPPGLAATEQARLSAIVRAGSLDFGFKSGVWTAPMIGEVIRQEFGVRYHPGHVRKLLYGLGFSVQRPKKLLARADPEAQERWRRYTYPRLKKKPAPKGRS
jgi:transposase